MQLMYRTEPINPGICPGRRNPDIDRLPSVWRLVAPGLHEQRSCIQVDRKYVVSVGAHFNRCCALLSEAHKISYLTAVEICNYLSFLFDTPIDVAISLRNVDAGSTFRGLSRYFRLRGFSPSGFKDIQRLIADPKEILASAEDGWQRLFPVDPRDKGRFLGFDLPTNRRLRNALVAYRQALLSVEPVGQILNYWRVLEATAKTPAKRTAILKDLFASRLQGVPCIDWHSHGEIRHFNLVAKYKRAIRPHYRRLQAIHKSDQSIITFLYKQRRCPSAHAARDVLRVDASTEPRDLYYDALLLKLLARLSIQRFNGAIAR